MKAEKIITFNGPTYVIVKDDSTDRYRPDMVITIHGGQSESVADGIVQMVNESQCAVCGKYNGLHSDVFYKTGQDQGGSVYGNYRKCPMAVKS